MKNPRGDYAVEVTYDKYGRKTAEKDAIGRSTSLEYGKPGTRQTTTTDPGGKKWVDTYDRKGHLLSRKDPLGNTTGFRYDSRGNVVRRTDPLGWATYISYDGRANPIGETNSLGQARRWVYHAHYNKPIEEVDTAGWSTFYTYDSAGNLTTNWDTLGTLSAHTYYSNGLAKTSADANGRVTSFTYTPDGFLASKTDPLSNTWTYAYTELGWLTAVTNPLNQATTHSHDLNGNRVQTVDPLRTLTRTFDANGNLLSETDAKGAAASYKYDAANQRTQMVDRAGAKWGYSYTTRGALYQTTDPASHTRTRGYDDANRLTSVTDPLGNSESIEYDPNGNILSTTDREGRKSRKEYDRLNRVIAETDPLGNIKKTAYDAAGRVQSITTPRGFPSTHEYDGRGRLTRWLDAEGFEWLYQYDQHKNITNIVDALGGNYSMAYSPRNERTMERNQDGFTWLYLYDELGRVEQQTDPNGTTRNVVYDAGGRIDYVWFSTGRTDDYGYTDTSENVTTLSRSSPIPPTTSQFQYDSMDRVTEYTDTFSKKVKWTYDSLGRVSSIIYPDNKVLTNRFDALSRLIEQEDWDGRTLEYTYDKANRLVTRTYPNGIVQTNAYDSAGRLVSLEYRSAGNPLVAFEYAYDQSGNKTRHYEQGTLNWALPERIDENATFTPAGRLIQRTDAMNASNAFTYAYDDAGNMTNAIGVGESFAFSYDEDNRVLSAMWTAGGTTNVHNRYDALGRRISKNVAGVETRYALDLSGRMERILCDMNASGQITAWYVHGADLCYKVTSGGALTCYHTDAQGNVVALSDQASSIATRYAYTPYGRIIAIEGGDSDVYRFGGSQGVMQDLPGLYFMRARYYSARDGLFLSVDPVRHVGPTWVASAYRYAGANPLSYADPRGLFLKKLWNSVKSWVSKTVSSAKQKVSNAVAKAVTSVARRVAKSGGGGRISGTSGTEGSSSETTAEVTPKKWFLPGVGVTDDDAQYWKDQGYEVMTFSKTGNTLADMVNTLWYGATPFDRPESKKLRDQLESGAVSELYCWSGGAVTCDEALRGFDAPEDFNVTYMGAWANEEKSRTMVESGGGSFRWLQNEGDVVPWVRNYDPFAYGSGLVGFGSRLYGTFHNGAHVNYSY